jgi:hypothetical protein
MIEVDGRLLRSQRHDRLGACHEHRERIPGELHQRLTRRRAQAQEQDVGRRRRSQADVPVPDGPVQPGPQQVSADQPGDPVLGAGTGATERDRDGEGVACDKENNAGTSAGTCGSGSRRVSGREYPDDDLCVMSTGTRS